MSYTNKIVDPGLTFSGSRTKRTKTEGILIHHPDADWTVQQVHNYHKNTNGWIGIGYNFYIDKDGTIYSGRGMEYVGAHCTNYNSKTIGVCCRGQYHDRDTSMPDAQFNALVWLLQYLRGVYGSSIYIKGHRDVASTACPGQYFPLAEAQKLIYRSEQEPDAYGCYCTLTSGTTTQGASGDAVKAIQERLVICGYDLSPYGGTDGDYGAGTAAMVKQFQTDIGLTATGSADQTTKDALQEAAQYCYEGGLTMSQIEKLIDSKIKTALAGDDTTVSDWAKEEFAEAKAAGITDGTRPQGYATRQEAAIMTKRALKGE